MSVALTRADERWVRDQLARKLRKLADEVQHGKLVSLSMEQRAEPHRPIRVRETWAFETKTHEGRVEMVGPR